VKQASIGVERAGPRERDERRGQRWRTEASEISRRRAGRRRGATAGDRVYGASVRGSDGRRHLRSPGVQLPRDGDRSKVVATGEFGMPEDEGRRQGERDEKN